MQRHFGFPPTICDGLKPTRQRRQMAGLLRAANRLPVGCGRKLEEFKICIAAPPQSGLSPFPIILFAAKAADKNIARTRSATLGRGKGGL